MTNICNTQSIMSVSSECSKKKKPVSFSFYSIKTKHTQLLLRALYEGAPNLWVHSLYSIYPRNT